MNLLVRLLRVHRCCLIEGDEVEDVERFWLIYWFRYYAAGRCCSFCIVEIYGIHPDCTGTTRMMGVSLA